MKPFIATTLSALLVFAAAGAAAQDTPSRAIDAPPRAAPPDTPPRAAPPGTPPPTFPQAPASPGLGVTTPHTISPASPGVGVTDPASPTGVTGGRPSVDRPLTDPRLGGRISETAPGVPQSSPARSAPDR